MTTYHQATNCAPRSCNVPRNASAFFTINFHHRSDRSLYRVLGFTTYFWFARTRLPLFLFPDLFSLPRLPLFPRLSSKSGNKVRSKPGGVTHGAECGLICATGGGGSDFEKGSDCWVEPGFFQDTPLTTQGSSQEEEKRENQS